MLIATEGAQERLKVLLQGLMSLSPASRGPAFLALPLAALLGLFAVACGGEAGSRPTASTEEPTVAGQTITVHSSPTCGCCGEYERYLEEEGFEVKTIKTDDTSALKDSFGVPQDMRSCHTSMVNGYFVEGHVPVEAIWKLLEERPQIEGIALPAMPSGSPGMPGIKAEPFTIYAIVDSRVSEFETL